MPSQQLKQIADQIEANGTDDFSKFYMYAGLLNLIAVREQNMNFFSAQPETAPLIFRPKKLQIGNFPGEFNRQVNAYKTQFDVPAPDQMLVIQKIIMAYARKGQLADLVYIVDKMVDHLSVSNLKPTNEHNKDIYDSINFEKKRAAVYDFINGVSALNHQFLSALDGSMNSIISAGVAVAGLVVILSSVFSLAGLLIGGAMLVGGAYCSYSYAEQALGLAEHLKKSVSAVMAAAETMNRTMGAYESIINDGTHKNFITRGLVKPMIFAAVTVAEQVAVDDESAKKAEEQRTGLSVSSPF